MTEVNKNEIEKIDFTLKPNRFTYIFAISGVLGACLHNAILRRIYWSGIYKHIGLALGGGYLGTKYGHWGEIQHAKRDYILYEYMARHPEDFKKPPVKLVGERLDKWTPIR